MTLSSDLLLENTQTEEDFRTRTISGCFAVGKYSLEHSFFVEGKVSSKNKKIKKFIRAFLLKCKMNDWKCFQLRMENASQGVAVKKNNS